MKPLLAPAALAALFALAAPASAQTAAAAGPAAPAAAQERVNQLIVYGNDPCPQSTDEEIIVCARRPESDRYRIPEDLRGNPNDPGNQAWTNRATELQYVGRAGTGSCSPVGPGGMTGCYSDMVRAARNERAGSPGATWEALIEEARRERLGRIDADAAAIEEEQNPRP
jgi:hypothetical protein